MNQKPLNLLTQVGMATCTAITLAAGCTSGVTSTNSQETTPATTALIGSTSVMGSTSPTTSTTTTSPTTTSATTEIPTTEAPTTTMLETPPGVWVPNNTNKNGEPIVWTCGTIRVAVNGPEVLQKLVQDATTELNNKQTTGALEETGVKLQIVPLHSQENVTVNWTWSSRKPEKGKTWSSGWTDIKNNGTTYTGGHVDINPAMADAPPLQQETIRHELGHVLGLGHNNDPASIMNSQTVTTIDYNNNDLAGIAWLNNHCKQPGS